MRDEKARRSFALVSNNANSLRKSLSISSGTSGDSVIADSSRWDEDFTFDNIVLNTTVYRKAFIAQRSKAQLRDKQDEDSTFPKGKKSPSSTHSQETMKGIVALELDPKDAAINLGATGEQKSIETPLKTHPGDSSNKFPATATPNISSSNTNKDKPQTNEIPSLEQLPATGKAEASIATIAQNQNDGLSFFQDYYSPENTIHRRISILVTLPLCYGLTSHGRETNLVLREEMCWQ